MSQRYYEQIRPRAGLRYSVSWWCCHLDILS